MSHESETNVEAKHAKEPQLDLDGEQIIDITGWQSLKLATGDIIFLQPDRELPPNAIRNIASELARMTKEVGVKVMLVPYGWTASVLTPAKSNV